MSDIYKKYCDRDIENIISATNKFRDVDLEISFDRYEGYSVKDHPEICISSIDEAWSFLAGLEMGKVSNNE